MPRVKGTRVVARDVGRYGKKDTGTANDPVKKSARMTTTRITSGGVGDKEPKGVNATKTSSRMRGVRVTKA
jgi:hypothetical protein